jgi:rhodanese-related sulfurtransferase
VKFILFTISLLFAIIFYGQNPDGFDKMVKSYVKGKVNLVNPEDCEGDQILFLDARELEEYKTSHIKDALYIGYDDFNISVLDTVNRDAKIVVYCSIGYRSEKIGQKLLKEGYSDVSNLYGGIFNWSNNGFPVFSANGRTQQVHGYSDSWAKWLNQDKVTIITGKKK